MGLKHLRKVAFVIVCKVGEWRHENHMVWQNQQQDSIQHPTSKAPLPTCVWALRGVVILENRNFPSVSPTASPMLQCYHWMANPRHNKGRDEEGAQEMKQAQNLLFLSLWDTHRRGDPSLAACSPQQTMNNINRRCRWFGTHQYRTKAPMLKVTWFCWKYSLKELQERFRRWAGNCYSNILPLEFFFWKDHNLLPH